jgi:uncharacterized phiE125 gp8 family phage protein
MSIIVKVAPTVEPISLERAKAHLRVDVTDDDALIQDQIRAARRFLERRYDRALLTQTLVRGLDAFPMVCWAPGGWMQPVIELRPPVQSVTSVTYLDTVGATQTLAPATYFLDKDSEPGRLALNIGKSWPATAPLPNAVLVEWLAGATNPDLVEPDIQQANLFVLGHLYENRETVITGTISKAIELGVDELMRSYRRDLVA